MRRGLTGSSGNLLVTVADDADMVSGFKLSEEAAAFLERERTSRPRVK